MSVGRVPAQVVVYVAAIFLTYLTLGVMMMSGIDFVLPVLLLVGFGLFVSGVVEYIARFMMRPN